MTKRTLDHVIPALLALVIAPPEARWRVARRLLTDWLEWTSPPPPLHVAADRADGLLGRGDFDRLRRQQYGKADPIGIGATL